MDKIVQSGHTSALLPISAGKGELILFDDLGDQKEHFAFALGKIKPGATPLVRVHSECITGEVFGSLRCDCKWQLETAIESISNSPTGGYIIYLRQEGRGIGVKAKLQAYNLQDEGLDTEEANVKLGFGADDRSYDLAANILKQLGVQKVDLLTNNPAKVEGLETCGITVSKRVEIEAPTGNEWDSYLEAKAKKFGHKFKNR